MKSITIKTLSVLLVGTVLASCLDGNVPTTPPGASPTIVEMSFDPAPGGAAPTLLYTGLAYFANQTLLLSPAATSDTVVFTTTIQGVVTKDVTLTLATPQDAADDNFAKDKIVYKFMTSDQYKFLNTTAVIKAGKTYAEFKVVFFPPKINFSESLILPVTVSNDAQLPISSSFGILYFHTIGNAIAGLYKWDWIRCEDPACSAGPGPSSFYGHATVFAPSDETTVTVPTGYYDQPNYIITFTNTNGVLSNFKAVLDPAAVNGSWTTGGITLVNAPTILVENNNTKFTINYTTNARNITDVFYK